MNRSLLLADRLREVLLSGRFIANTNYQEQLMQTSLEQAVTQIAQLNTIAALSYHINYYLAGIINVLNGGALEIRDKYSFDLPPINSESDWLALRDEFLRNAELFTQKVALLSDEQLDSTFVKPEYGTYQRNMEGVIEHAYYHLGQIVIIRKMITARSLG